MERFFYLFFMMGSSYTLLEISTMYCLLPKALMRNTAGLETFDEPRVGLIVIRVVCLL